jgi:hypothetical protein
MQVQTRRVLIVAAHPGVRAAVSRALAKGGFVAQPCATVRDAQAHPFDELRNAL